MSEVVLDIETAPDPRAVEIMVEEKAPERDAIELARSLNKGPLYRLAQELGVPVSSDAKKSGMLSMVENELEKAEGLPEALEPVYDETLQELREKVAEKAALSPATARVIAVAAVDLHGTPLQVEASDDEALVLDAAHQACQGAPLVVTFNGDRFDLPVLNTRWRLHRMRIPPPVRKARRYRDDPHFDVRMELTGWDHRQAGTLSFWCRLFGVEPPIRHSYDEMLAAFEEGSFEEISEICLSDARQTAALYGIVSGREVEDKPEWAQS